MKVTDQKIEFWPTLTSYPNTIILSTTLTLLLSTQLSIHKQSVNFKNPSTFLSKAENNLSKHLKNHQLNLIRTNKKLKFYSVFKNETNHSEFIHHIRNPEHRRVASKFRIGNHNLKIETGRLTTPKLLKILESVIIATKIRL